MLLCTQDRRPVRHAQYHIMTSCPSGTVYVTIYIGKHYRCTPYFHMPYFRSSGWLQNTALHTNYFGLMLVQPRKFCEDCHQESESIPCQLTKFFWDAHQRMEEIHVSWVLPNNKQHSTWMDSQLYQHHACVYHGLQAKTYYHITRNPQSTSHKEIIILTAYAQSKLKQLSQYLHNVFLVLIYMINTYIDSITSSRKK